jgi:large subunit ribosomal protein L4
MLSARFYSASGESMETRELPMDPFDGVVHEAALHQVVKAHLANRRQGNASTKNRSAVSGGGRKAWRQKGTGRARQGSIRAPHWKGGGVAFGPTPRSYHQDVPRKVRLLGRRSAFNVRALADQVSVVEGLSFDAPKTRQMADLLGKVAADARRVLILTNGINREALLSARNLQNVEVLPFTEASAYDIMVAKHLVIEADALAAAGQEVAHA